MNETFPFIYWYGIGGVILLALLSGFFLYNFLTKPKSFKP